MRWPSIIFFTAIISIGVSMLLSLLPDLSEQQLDISQTYEVQQASLQHHSLTEHNLVDHIVKLSPQLNMERVDWNHSILSLDLSVSADQSTPELIYQELIRINDFALHQMSNVKRVHVRVFYEKNDGTESVLVLAMDAPRDDWSVTSFQLFGNQSITAKQFLERFHLTYTKEWSKYIFAENQS